MGKTRTPESVARTVRTVTEETINGDSELELDGAGSEDFDADAEALSKLRELGGGQDTRYQVRRTSPSQKAGYVGTLSDDELTLDGLAEAFGPGSYNVRGRRGDGSFLPSTNVRIAESARTRIPEIAAPTVQQGLTLADVMAVMNAQPRGDTMQPVLAMMMKQMEANQQMLMALLNRAPPTPPPAPDPLAMIAAMKDILKPEKSAESVMDMFLKGLTMGKELGGDEGGSNWMDLAGKGLDAVKPLLAQLPARAAPQAEAPPQRAPQPALPTPPPQIANQQPKIEQEPEQEIEDVNIKLALWVKGQVASLCRLAKAQKDPALYAEVFLDNLPEYVTDDVILEQFQQADALDKLAMLDSRVATYRTWFEAFRAEVVNVLALDAETVAAQQPEDSREVFGDDDDTQENEVLP